MDEDKIPMKSGSEDNEVKGGSEKMFVISRTRAIMLVIFVIVLIVFVGVLSGVLSAKQARREATRQGTKEVPVIGSTEKPKATVVLPTEPTGPEPWYKIRLPENIRPVHYDFRLDPHLEDNTFEGNVSILVTVTAKSDFMRYILVHVNEMNVTYAKVFKPAQANSTILGSEVPVRKTFEYPKNDFFIFELESDLVEQGNYVLVMAYKSTFSSQLNGLYISTYKNKKGETRRLATTKFEPTDARKALPLFDEPAMKATFSTVIIHDKDYTALSNMPVKEKKMLPNGRVASHFMKSVPMSTYLLAFIVCDFEFTNATTGVYNNITLRVWTTPAQINQTKFALEVGKDIITYFEGYYQLGYPLPKQDMIAIPDFSSGAMENWGLITYRESRLLYQEGVSSESSKQRTAVVVSHELAHQWFGNIVSPKWWNDLWLNEGFASFVEYLGVNHTHPDWNMMEQFLLLDLQRVLPLDSLASSHPISVEVNQPKKIKQIFDVISYSKGSSIIRMLEGFLGREKFKDGLSFYLRKYAFNNAETNDLWNALGEKANMDVKTVMDTWTLQMGFPLVTIKRKVGDPGKAVATQKHFLLDPNANVTTQSPFNYKWYVPLTYVFQDSSQSSKLSWMNTSSESVEFDWPQDKWIKANFKQVGFYRVNYDEDNWKALVKQLNDDHSVFTAEDRSSLIDDAFNLARAGHVDYKIAMSTLQYLSKEKNYVPWKTALNRLGSLKSLLSLRPSYGLLQKLIRNKVKPLAERLGWESKSGEGHIDKSNMTKTILTSLIGFCLVYPPYGKVVMLEKEGLKEKKKMTKDKPTEALQTYLRSSILGAVCSAGDPDANENATTIFKEWMMGKRSTIAVDLRTRVYYYGIANTGEKEWDWMFEKFMNTSEASEKNNLMYALAASRTPWILNRYLEYSLDSSKVRSQDAVSVINYVAFNPVGKYLAWTFVQSNWNTLYDMFSSSTFRLTSLTNAVTQFTTQADLLQMKAFFKGSDAGTSENARRQAVERTQANIEWLKNYEDAISDWLNVNVGA